MRNSLLASESGGEHGVTFAEYISHHLQHLSSAKEDGLVNLAIIHIDTLFFSLLTGLLMLFVLWLASRRATTGVPGRWQAAVEILVEFVHDQAKAMVHGKLDFIAPLALTVFLWVTFMNAIDLFPVDWLPWIGHNIVGTEHLRPLPTADINATLGMSIAVFLLVIYYNIKIKGFGGWLHQWVSAPFGAPKFTMNPLSWIGGIVLSAANVFMTAVEYVSSTFSHGVRLYGNMYAGELIFFLIAGLGGSLTVFGVAAHLLTGTVWALFHVLIVLLQAFIFMMLTLVYIGQAHDKH